MDNNAAHVLQCGIVMKKKSKTTKTAESDGRPDRILIKRYGNRRLYNTETSGYLNYQELISTALVTSALVRESMT